MFTDVDLVSRLGADVRWTALCNTCGSIGLVEERWLTPHYLKKTKEELQEADVILPTNNHDGFTWYYHPAFGKKMEESNELSDNTD